MNLYACRTQEFRKNIKPDFDRFGPTSKSLLKKIPGYFKKWEARGK